MLKDPSPQQHELEMVTLEELVPSNHLLRQIEAALDFSFIRERVRHLYCADNGRPALDPVLLFKALFIGYLFGVIVKFCVWPVRRQSCLTDRSRVRRP